MTAVFDIFDATGLRVLSMAEALPRIVHSQRFPAAFTGSFTVPEFDIAQGLFYYSPVPVITRSWISGASRPLARQPDAFDFSAMTAGFGVHYPVLGNVFALPSMSWDEPTRTMTVAPSDLPSNWPQYFEGQFRYPYVGNNTYRPDYFITFLHVHRRVEVA